MTRSMGTEAEGGSMGCAESSTVRTARCAMSCKKLRAPAARAIRRRPQRGMQRAVPISRRESHMKATDMLKKQHREVAALFKTALGEEQAANRVKALQQITQKLEVHTAIEEE